MNIYLISQDVNTGYDTFDSAVVCAVSEEDARDIHPYEYEHWGNKERGTWCFRNEVKVDLIGVAKRGAKREVICSSFNAG